MRSGMDSLSLPGSEPPECCREGVNLADVGRFITLRVGRKDPADAGRTRRDVVMGSWRFAIASFAGRSPVGVGGVGRDTASIGRGGGLRLPAAAVFRFSAVKGVFIDETTDASGAA
jgi:hypothetical protein